VSWGGRVIDGFENARVGVEPAEVVDIVGSREVVVTISDKFVKIGGLCRGEREGCVAKVVKGCEDVSESQMGDEKERRTGIVGLERANEFVQHPRKTRRVTRDRDRARANKRQTPTSPREKIPLLSAAVKNLGCSGRIPPMTSR
jgi:hypothetical protein